MQPKLRAVALDPPSHSVFRGPAAGVSPGEFLDIQNLKPSPRLTESESTIRQDPQVILVHIKH